MLRPDAFQPTPVFRCPRCPASTLGPGPLHHCRGCEGVWIEEQALEAKVSRSAAAPLDWAVAPSRERLPCASCRQPMTALVLWSEPVDRCKDHGVWFDKHELTAVLDRSAQRPLATPHVSRGVAADLWVADAAVEVAAVGIEVAAEAGSGIASVVVEGVLEVIGGIFSAIDF